MLRKGNLCKENLITVITHIPSDVVMPMEVMKTM